MNGLSFPEKKLRWIDRDLLVNVMIKADGD